MSVTINVWVKISTYESARLVNDDEEPIAMRDGQRWKQNDARKLTKHVV